MEQEEEFRSVWNWYNLAYLTAFDYVKSDIVYRLKPQDEEYKRISLSLSFCFSNRGNTKGENSSKIMFLTFMYVLFYVNLCQD